MLYIFRSRGSIKWWLFRGENVRGLYMGWVDNIYIGALKKIVDKFNAKIVLSSDWKLEYNKEYEKCGLDAQYLIDKLAKYDLKIIDKTEDINDLEREEMVF